MSYLEKPHNLSISKPNQGNRGFETETKKKGRVPTAEHENCGCCPPKEQLG